MSNNTIYSLTDKNNARSLTFLKFLFIRINVEKRLKIFKGNEMFYTLIRSQQFIPQYS